MLNVLLVATFILKSSREGIVSKFNLSRNGPSLENLQTSLVKVSLHESVLTSCYAEHALGCSIHFKIIQRRHFIKIKFVNKQIKFINLPRIFKGKALSLPLLSKVRKRAKIRNRYNQVPHLTQDTNGKVSTSQLDITNESQEVSLFPAGDLKVSTNRRA